MITHEHRLPATPEEFMDVWAGTFEPSEMICTHCGGPLAPALSITSALQLKGMPPSLLRMFQRVRREFGPWAVVSLCGPCGDVPCWPVTEAMRREIFEAITSYVE